MLRAEGLAAIRGERLVFRDLDFALEAGGALLLVGPNGSGKSTLLRLLAGLGRMVAGRLLWDGRDALADLPAHAARVAYLGHQDAIKLGLTAAENLRFAAAQVGGGPPHPGPLPQRGGEGESAAESCPPSGIDPPLPRWGERAGVRGQAIAAALDAVGLGPLADLPARLLSAGQRRRLALARLLLSPARLWLLDEPTLGLDTDSVARLAPVLAVHRATGGLLVAATHLPLPLPDAGELRLS